MTTMSSFRDVVRLWRCNAVHVSDAILAMVAGCYYGNAALSGGDLMRKLVDWSLSLSPYNPLTDRVPFRVTALAIDRRIRGRGHDRD